MYSSKLIKSFVALTEAVKKLSLDNDTWLDVDPIAEKLVVVVHAKINDTVNKQAIVDIVKEHFGSERVLHIDLLQRSSKGRGRKKKNGSNPDEYITLNAFIIGDE